MKPPAHPSKPDPASLDRKADELRQALRGAPPQVLAQRTQCAYTPGTPDQGIFLIEVWGSPITLSFPELAAVDMNKGGRASPLIELLLLYYFSAADGAPVSGRWISFADLPDGRFYNQAFQGYTGRELAKTIQSDAGGLALAARLSGGERDLDAPGDLAFRFQALPQVPLLLVYWQGDEDFPASCQVLFDASVSHYLPTDACAILGSNLTSRLKKNYAGGQA